MPRYTDLAPFLSAGNKTLSFLSKLDHHHKARIERYKKNWDFYEGNHWSYSDDRNVTFNYCSRIVDIKEDFLTKNGFTVSIPDLGSTYENETKSRSFVKGILDDQWERNEKEILFMEIAQSGGVTGDAFIRPSLEIDPADGEVFVKLTVLPSHYVFPIYGGERGYDRKTMSKCHFVYPMYDEIPLNDISLRTRESKEYTKVSWYREVWTRQKILTYKGDELISEEENLLGEIGIVHIKNRINKNDDFGISDLKDILPLQRLYNEKATDVSDIIDYHASPVTVAYGARFDTIERGPDKIWHINSTDARIENLQLSGDLKATKEFLDRIYKTILDVSGVPEQAMNPTNKISNTPGVAMHMSFMPLVENRSKKILSYGRGIKTLNRIILKSYAVAYPEFRSKLSLIKTRRFATDINFGTPLPRDQALELELLQKRLELGISSRLDELVKLGEGENDAIRKIEEADKDYAYRLLIKSKAESSGENAFGGLKSRPNPVVQGEKVSRKSE